MFSLYDRMVWNWECVGDGAKDDSGSRCKVREGSTWGLGRGCVLGRGLRLGQGCGIGWGAGRCGDRVVGYGKGFFLWSRGLE